MINIEPFVLNFVNNDSLWILLITIILSVIFNLYLRFHISFLYRVLAIWLFAYIFSLTSVYLYSNWLRNKVDSYADSLGFIFSLKNDVPQSAEFAIYLEALNHDTWRNLYFITGIIITLLIALMVEVFISMLIKTKQLITGN